MQVQFLSTIRSNVDRMSRLVSDLADVSRMESGHLRLEMTSVPIALVVEETLRSMQGQIEEKSQQLTVEVQDDLPPVMADQTRMTQVLTNLVSNAYKYTPENGDITITVEQTVDVDEEDVSQDVIQVAVTDTGIGMSPEDLEQLFSKFFRSSSVKGTVPGTGLGLNITKNLIELHGGRIWVESVEGEGTTFTYTIPVAEEMESASAD
jgi:signal transduction histidine kinase